MCLEFLERSGFVKKKKEQTVISVLYGEIIPKGSILSVFASMELLALDISL